MDFWVLLMPGAMRKVPSPCTGVCRIDDATGWCLGCRRTLDEIANWSTLSLTGRRAVLAKLPARK